MLSRRVFLKSGALTLFSMGAGPRFLDRLALAAPTPGPHPKVLVSIFLRGAMDGLMAVPPLDDPDLGQFRPRLAMSAARASAARPMPTDSAPTRMRSGLSPCSRQRKPSPSSPMRSAAETRRSSMKSWFESTACRPILWITRASIWLRSNGA